MEHEVMTRSLTQFLALLLVSLLCLSSGLSAQDSENPQTYSQMACEKDDEVDSCWLHAKSFAKGEPTMALFYFEQSCEFGQNPWGCYEAGKIYLHNSDLWNYARAKQRFTKICMGSDIGAGPFACKFLGWMHMAGIGMDKDQETAANLLSKACFFHNILTTDPEGCTLLAEGLLNGQFDSIINAEKIRKAERPKYLAYLAYSRACLDGASDVCKKANELLGAEKSANAGWVEICSYLAPAGYTCADLSILGRGYEQDRDVQINLISQFAQFKH